MVAFTLLSFGCNRNQDMNRTLDDAQMEQERPQASPVFDRTNDTVTEPLDERPYLK